MGTAARAGRRREADLIDPRFAKAIGHPLRVEILAACSVAPISEAEFRTRRPQAESHQLIRYHWGILLECEVIEWNFSHLVKGKWVPYYVATQRALLNEEPFDSLPAVLQGSLSGVVVATFLERFEDALHADTVDTRPERHLTWTPLALDPVAFGELMERLDDVFHWLDTAKVEARDRLQASGQKPVYATVGMFGFESPAPGRDHDMHL